MMVGIQQQLPEGLTARRTSGGRKGASRWEVYKGKPDFNDPHTCYAAWLGDIVSWQPEDVWDWQPSEGEIQTYPNATEAIAAIKFQPDSTQDAPLTAATFAEQIRNQDPFIEIDATEIAPLGSGNYVASFEADMGGPFTYAITVKRYRKGQQR
jgi:hypothetical protein